MPRPIPARSHRDPRRARRRLRTAVALLVLGLAGGGLAPAGAAGTGTISGVAFEDSNRDGVRQAAEAAYQGHRIYLYDGSGTYLAYTATDASGRYAFGGLAGGAYRVEYAPQTWFGLRDTLVPTTTGTVRPTHHVTLGGTAPADFGWRSIVTSSDLAAPVSEVVTANGTRVASYNDAVSAEDVAVALSQGLLFGDEAAHTTMRFAYGTTSTCTTGVAWVDGAYDDFHAWCHVSYASWLDEGDRTLFHEFGHAWGYYHAYMAQQDPGIASYLEARGLLGDDRLGTSHAWNRHEILAEDYRQLFGSPNARQGGQMNRDIPSASAVPGLEDFLSTTFRTPVTEPTAPSAPPPGEEPAPAPAPTSVRVTDLEGRAGASAKGQWRGEAVVHLLDDTGAPVTGAGVTMSWQGSRGESATSTCTTGTNGSCQVSVTVKKTTEWVRFTVAGVAAEGLAYTGTANTDADGDTNGTTVVVPRAA